MKVLRVTSYDPGNLDPMTMVMTENDLAAPIDEAAEEMHEVGDPLGVFAVVDIFEVEDDTDIVRATLQAQERAVERNDDERNMAILFYWDAMHFQMIAPHGLITTSQPSPLTVEQVAYTLRRLAKHPGYQHQRVICHAKDFTPVTMVDGDIIEPKGEGDV